MVSQVTPSHQQQSIPIFHEFFGGLQNLLGLPTEKEFLKWSKAEFWLERQRGVDELKEKEERDELGRERKRKKMRKKGTRPIFALALIEIRRKKDICILGVLLEIEMA